MPEVFFIIPVVLDNVPALILLFGVDNSVLSTCANTGWHEPDRVVPMHMENVNRITWLLFHILDLCEWHDNIVFISDLSHSSTKFKNQ
jgi:hypothetical protein